MMSICAFSHLSAAELRLVAGDGDEFKRFGYTVAVDSGFMAVGSPGITTDRNYRGSVYVFQDSLSFWIQHSQLAAVDPLPYDFFGCSVAMHKDILLVGAQGDSFYNKLSGAAFLFQREADAYIQKAVFRSPALVPKDLFGYSVALSEGLCAVGAPADGGLLPSSGAVYLYKPDSANVGKWVLDSKIIPKDSKYFNFFGSAVALSGNRLIVGAPHAFSPLKTAGDAYIFEKKQGVWIQTAKLTPPDGNFRNMYGFSVDIDGDLAVVGAFKDDVLDFDTGSAYVYRFETDKWLADTKMTAVDADSGDYFGYSVALYKNYLVAGAPGDNGNGPDAGSIYAFLSSPSGWSQKAKKAAGDQVLKDKFGSAVAVGKDVTGVGAPHKKVIEKKSQGVVYVYNNLDDLALPVTLTLFTATTVEGHVVLKWITQSEIDNLGFIVQRRLDSTNWEKIADFQNDAALLGRGSSSVAAEYRFIDDQAISGLTYFYRLGDVNVSGVVTFHPEIQVSVALHVTADAQPLSDYALHPAFPNPFNPRTTIHYDVRQPGEVQVAVYDMRGRMVRMLTSAFVQSGAYSVIWDGRDDAGEQKSSGVYIIQLTARDMKLTQKVILLE